MLFAILASILTVGLVVDYIYRNMKNKPMRSIPWLNFKTYPIIGQSHIFVGEDETRMASCHEIGKQTADLGGISQLAFARRILVTLTEPEDVNMLLRTCLAKDDVMDVMKVFTGTGSLTAAVPIWKPRRRQTVHAFSSKMLQQFVEVFVQGGEELVSELRKVAGRGPFTAWRYLASYTMDSVCITNLGIDVNAQKSEGEHPFITAFNDVLGSVTARMLQPWLHPDFIYKMLPISKTAHAQLAYLDNFIKSVIRRKREKKRGNLKEESPMQNAISPGIRSFVEILMEGVGDTDGLNDEELTDECKVIAAAGTDTTAVGICFTLNQLARHPHVQEKVFQEVKEVFGESGRSMVREDLAKLRYTEAVIRESIRLYPPVPVIIRKVHKEITLPSGHTLIPGTGVIIHIWMMHRNPKYWGQDVHLFRPDRFLDNPNPNPCYIPFSHGPRNCIGYQYAVMSMKTAVAHVVRSYTILPAPSKLNPTPHENSEPNANEEEKPMRLKYDIMMKDVDNFPLQLEARKT